MSICAPELCFSLSFYVCSSFWRSFSFLSFCKCDLSLLVPCPACRAAPAAMSRLCCVHAIPVPGRRDTSGERHGGDALLVRFKCGRFVFSGVPKRFHDGGPAEALHPLHRPDADGRHGLDRDTRGRHELFGLLLCWVFLVFSGIAAHLSRRMRHLAVKRHFFYLYLRHGRSTTTHRFVPKTE